jgi:hypothetical protein
MCCGEKQGHHAGPMHHGAHHSGRHGAHGMCGCEEKQDHHSDAHGMCGCAGRRFLSKKEQIEVLEEYKESLKCELEGVEEELKRLQVD